MYELFLVWLSIVTPYTFCDDWYRDTEGNLFIKNEAHARINKVAIWMNLIEEDTCTPDIPTLRNLYLELSSCPDHSWVYVLHTGATKEQIIFFIEQNYRLMCYCDHRLAAGEEIRYHTLLKAELRKRWNIWYQLEYLCRKPDGSYIFCFSMRKKALRELRLLMGDEAFYSGRVPAYLPFELMRGEK